jgi:hypothetical protein
LKGNRENCSVSAPRRPSVRARYDKNYRELKGIKKGQLVMVEAKHISVPAKRVLDLYRAIECER